MSTKLTKKEAAALLREAADEMDCVLDEAGPRDLDRWAANLRTVADDLAPRSGGAA